LLGSLHRQGKLEALTNVINAKDRALSAITTAAKSSMGMRIAGLPLGFSLHLAKSFA
jgi:hypothetical protein